MKMAGILAFPKERGGRGTTDRYQGMPEVMPLEGDDDDVAVEREERHAVKATRMPNEPRANEVAARNVSQVLSASTTVKWAMACRCWQGKTTRRD